MTSTSEIRKKFLEFFKEKQHTVIPSTSLIPENDPTVLFTTAGMHPLVPYLLSEPHPGGTRLTSCQKCVRTVDVDEVGDVTHLTFFEMLGNWSLGDYFKKEAIEMSFEFLTSPRWLGLNVNLIAVSVFAGDNDAPFDQEAFDIWKGLGIPEARIAKLPKKNNWWGPAGTTGPCGPDTEMFYWTGDLQHVPASFNDDHPLWVEIWNDVFMQYNKKEDGSYVPLKQKNVDTGMGLERVVAVLNNVDIYHIDTFKPIIASIENISGKTYGLQPDHTRAIRVVADHIRAAVLIMGDERGVTPSNVGQGYVVRRLIRRAVRYGKILGIERKFISVIAQDVIRVLGDTYQELIKNKEKILEELTREEDKFEKTLEKGLGELKKIAIPELQLYSNENKISVEGGIDGKNLFFIFQTYGFPLEMSLEEIDHIRIEGQFHNLLTTERKEKILRDFNEELKKHQELSRTASSGVFKGGLADHSEIATRYHTATHLLLASLRQLLGDEIYQKGSNITAERMRFDFNYPEKLTTEQIKKIEDLVNQKIQEAIPVEMHTMPKEEALASVKVSFDPSKYSEIVKVYTIGDFSSELCGGPHVSNTKEVGTFTITKEDAVSAGVRRIRAVIT